MSLMVKIIGVIWLVVGLAGVVIAYTPGGQVSAELFTAAAFMVTGSLLIIYGKLDGIARSK